MDVGKPEVMVQIGFSGDYFRLPRDPTTIADWTLANIRQISLGGGARPPGHFVSPARRRKTPIPPITSAVRLDFPMFGLSDYRGWPRRRLHRPRAGRVYVESRQ